LTINHYRIYGCHATAVSYSLKNVCRTGPGTDAFSDV